MAICFEVRNAGFHILTKHGMLPPFVRSNRALLWWSACHAWIFSSNYELRSVNLTSLSRPNLRLRIIRNACQARYAMAMRDCIKERATTEIFLRKNGAPERIRTSDPQIRSLVLYPAELRAPGAGHASREGVLHRGSEAEWQPFGGRFWLGFQPNLRRKAISARIALLRASGA